MHTLEDCTEPPSKAYHTMHVANEISQISQKLWTQIHAILSNVDSPGTLELPYTTLWDNHFQGEMGMRVLF